MPAWPASDAAARGNRAVGMAAVAPWELASPKSPKLLATFGKGCLGEDTWGGIRNTPKRKLGWAVLSGSRGGRHSAPPRFPQIPPGSRAVNTHHPPHKMTICSIYKTLSGSHSSNTAYVRTLIRSKLADHCRPLTPRAWPWGVSAHWPCYCAWQWPSAMGECPHAFHTRRPDPSSPPSSVFGTSGLAPAS